MQVREKEGKSRFTVFFPVAPESRGSKSNLAKAAGAEPSGQMRNEKLHAVVVRSTFPLLTAEMRFCVAGARDCAPCPFEQNGFL